VGSKLDADSQIVKKTSGSRGNGVILVNGASQLSAVTGLIPANEQTGFIVQQYIGDQPGRDVRVIVIAGTALAAMQRVAKPGEPRANASRGGQGEPYPLTPKSVELSERVAQLLDLEVAGIDLLFSHDGYCLCEANAQPGFSTFEESCKVNVAGAIADYIVKRIPVERKAG
jgi:RimK family alpha-L-glutamate ligase